jgi:hypothetical protein
MEDVLYYDLQVGMTFTAMVMLSLPVSAFRSSALPEAHYSLHVVLEAAIESSM